MASASKIMAMIMATVRINKLPSIFIANGSSRRLFSTSRSLRASEKSGGSGSKKPPAAPPKGTPYKTLSIGVPKEIFPNEKRVAITPAVTQIFAKKGFTVNVEHDAGAEAKFSDKEYEAAGGKIATDKSKIYNSDFVLKVRSPATSEIGLFKEKGTLVSFLYPAQNKPLVDELAKRKLTVFAMDCVPRISRAQVNIFSVFGHEFYARRFLFRFTTR